MNSLHLYKAASYQSPSIYYMTGRLLTFLANKRLFHCTQVNGERDSIEANWNSSKCKIHKRKKSSGEGNDRTSSLDEPATKIQKISPNLQREIERLLRTEHHHIIHKEKKNDSLIPDVEWCYYYVNPKLPGHITGGRAHLHHFCRVCKRTCLHLLGKYGTGQRKCLVCAADEMGWGKDEVPSWYFHDTCEHCKNDTRRRSGRGDRGGRYRG